MPARSGYDGTEIAVIGLAGRFPGAPDIDAFWQNLARGVESITVFSAEELARAGEDPARVKDPEYVRARPILAEADRFDASFFGFTPREAEILDPQLRVFLECAWTALEHAGHDPERLPGRASLFAGASFSNYLIQNLYKNRPVMEAFGDLEATIYNVQDSLVTMVGYKLNLKGVCCAVQTFCSSSLVGVHLACQNLLSFESDFALAGGVTVYVPQTSGYQWREGSIVSRDGHCRAFDARADGTVFGSGAGVIVLRRLADALEQGDTVHAVIRGSAVNNDGATKVSFAAPGVVGQTEVVVEAVSAAGVEPDTIGYVEAHGTGTRLGDPAEVSALTKAFRTRTDRKGFCALGSVKTNVGHLDAAAGVAGLIKVILCLRHRQIPASLHFETPNPAIDFAASPFYVNTELREWARGPAPRRAGISAFGVGGTNAHVIVEEAPEAASDPCARPQLLVISAKTPEALHLATQRLAAHLQSGHAEALADVAYTLQVGRAAFAHRAFAVAATLAEAAAVLAGDSSAAFTAAVCDRRNPHVGLRFRSGPGAPMTAGRETHEQETRRLFESWGVRFDTAIGEPGAGRVEVEIDGAAGYEGLLHALGALWLAGVDVAWPALHAGERRRRVALPTYPFERQRYWVEPLAEEPKRSERNSADWLYVPVWKTTPPAASSPEFAAGRWLIFVDAYGIGSRIVEHLRDGGAAVRTVSAGSRFSSDGAGEYVLDPGSREGYDRLWEDLRRCEALPDRILHLWSLDPLGPEPTPEGRFRRASDLGFYSLLNLAASRPEGPLTLTAVSTGLHEVVGGEDLAPEHAPLLALCRVLPQEHHDLRCVSIDVDPSAEGPAALAEALLAELARAVADPVVAYRRGRRWVQDFAQVPAAAQEGASSRVREGGTYLITGGLGDVGYLLGVALAQQARARLVLTGRSGLPPRERWSEWTGGPEASGETALRIRKVLALESFGSEVLVLKADAASGAEMRAAVRAARERFGALHGVIHAAGDMSAGTLRPVRQLTREACERQFAPKVHGLFALNEALEGQAIDFCLFTSSLSSVLGGVGYAAYAGANAFMDAFAVRENQAGKRTFLSVGWDLFEFAGRNPSAAARQAAREGATLRPDEGIAVFDRVLRLRDLDRLVVSTTPLAARIERWVRPATVVEKRADGEGLRPRPRLTAAFVAPASDTEKILARMWQELFGIDSVGANDDFFELGGHSLFAARVLSRVRAALGVSLPLEAVFDAPTVATLATRVEAVRGAGQERGAPQGDRVEIEI